MHTAKLNQVNIEKLSIQGPSNTFDRHLIRQKNSPLFSAFFLLNGINSQDLSETLITFFF